MDRESGQDQFNIYWETRWIKNPLPELTRSTPKPSFDTATLGFMKEAMPEILPRTHSFEHGNTYQMGRRLII
ncbi:hypothetical protein A3J22_02985 [Candidatus Beckwithbacteria bacterium RIFCSPLOWO2_02_FULL_49_12]|nr:MAG: hypothetical protein UX50_C0007G0017 [Candidatus Beckwithbacteria bacterium GW2011_GWA1_46_30]KKU71433.1 MAG: hypothetical protein UX97_C0006G0017 [Candidatus Beckwithbacteria bacterium GW2011_GWA2_47_25]KKW03079.1 MAG: hypothetical protein UY37_C0007G0033 [Candidatus Beckwithbacteria bacterium GW2011_GWC2_49_11]OGD48423.1 MAG: hypothetical protein A2877_03200 [Candidatus Beckwithbacteria bacterium RIFCSPHIGHO2_01_FULL_49_39]OGD51552.1 MAG: hypothetical protein A3K56_03635 [Candidatus B